MKKLVIVGLGAVLLTAVMLFVGCPSPTGPGPEPIPPPDKIVGAFAFDDESGSIALEFPGKGARSAEDRASRMIYTISGTLTIGVEPNQTILTVSGSYDDSNGHVQADASGDVGAEPTEYTVDGYYRPGQAFEGWITRTRGGDTIVGFVGAMSLDEGEEADVYTGRYGATMIVDVWWFDEELDDMPDPLPPPNDGYSDTTYELDDQGIGAFCLTCREQDVLAMYMNHPDFDLDPSEDPAGVLSGQWVDPPDNTEFELLVEDDDGEEVVFGGGTISGSTVEGTWGDEDWLYWYDPDDELWYYVRITLDGTFEGGLVE